MISDGANFIEYLLQRLGTHHDREEIASAWPTYPRQVRDYYGSIEAIVDKKRVFMQHIAIFGLIGFFCELFTTAAIFTMAILSLPACSDTNLSWCFSLFPSRG